MSCLLLFLAAAFPRLAVAGLFFFSNYLDRAYHSLLLIVLGFLFLPLTTIVYAWTVNAGHRLDGIYLVAVVLAALFDMGLVGHGEYQRRSR